ncbi:antibiotic biosynthesis monooxygenase [Candidatus Mycobacterium wuenschmannii]|uniref:Antibiotic biosynthesis monooxygenase n=1 Tax=Candidatus Mycobacterium wuenschmannii TaxID=3027808 RepID=A0ABY8W0D3_9MYCO|nr:antibiotic biosynthesis monooxygenase [Candidatus Mycobacterium wuenschmannii]WIM88811.1 antibiotic biosynthesis monooxygenase [Candidatus Mycobacterium wuenschmannii]
MVIVAGYLVVESSQRDRYLQECVDVVEQARHAHGCLDFAITADLVESNRIAIFERWQSRADAEKFRGSGPSDEQHETIISASVCEYEVTGQRSLT